ncbi:hypothetical protein NL676_029847 [Syzygium grande]|nr:hypothetical protein NL676_029847 [Syzygium grande]
MAHRLKHATGDLLAFLEAPLRVRVLLLELKEGYVRIGPPVASNDVAIPGRYPICCWAFFFPSREDLERVQASRRNAGLASQLSFGVRRTGNLSATAVKGDGTLILEFEVEV